jgi:hypothetical protein
LLSGFLHHLKLLFINKVMRFFHEGHVYGYEISVLEQIIDGMASQVKNVKNCIFNLHCPPYNSGLDLAPKLEVIKGEELPVSRGREMVPVGSVAVHKMIEKYHPLYVNVHFNHPNELTEESMRALGLLADAGIPLGNQSVLLKGVNDETNVNEKFSS